MSYDLFTPPQALDFRNMSDGEACEYFNWFVKEVPRRLIELERASNVSLDFSVDSLSAVASWFGGYVNTRSRTADELDLEHEETPGWLHEYIGRNSFTEETLSLCIDIAIYFGEIIRRRNPALRWDYVKKPKKDADLHQPVLVPFPHNMHLNKVPLLLNVAGGVLQGEDAANELRRLLTEWQGMLAQDDPLHCAVVN